MLRGLREVEKDLADRKIPFFLLQVPEAPLRSPRLFLLNVGDFPYDGMQGCEDTGFINHAHLSCDSLSISLPHSLSLPLSLSVSLSFKQYSTTPLPYAPHSHPPLGRPRCHGARANGAHRCGHACVRLRTAQARTQVARWRREKGQVRPATSLLDK